MTSRTRASNNRRSSSVGGRMQPSSLPWSCNRGVAMCASVLRTRLDERERAQDRTVVLERCGEAALETGVQLVTARGVEREARRPGAPQAVGQGELAATHEMVGSRELEQAHIPALLPLLRGGERAHEGCRVRDREPDRATDVRR